MSKAHEGTGSRREFVLLFVAFAVLICLIGTGAYLALVGATLERAEGQLAAIAQLKGRQLENWLKERDADLRVASSLPLIGMPLDRSRLSPAEMRRLHRSLEEFQTAYGYLTVELVDRDGRQIDFAGKAIDTRDTRRPYVLETLRSNRQRQLLDFYRRDDPDHPVGLALAAPILDDAPSVGEPLGYLFLHLDPERDLYPMLQSWPLPSPSAESLLFRRHLDQVQFLNRLRHDPAPALTREIPLSRPNSPAARTILSGSATAEGIDYRGIPVLTASRSIAGSGWFILSKVDRDEVVADLRWLAAVLVALVVLLTAVVGIVLRLRYREQQFRQREALARQERLFLEVLDHAADAILIAEADGRLSYANVQATAMLGFGAETLTAMHWRELLADGLDWSTPAAGEAIFRRELRLRRWPEGTIPVEVSAAVLPDQRMCFAIRDISERIRLQQELQTREARFRDFSESSADWFWETDTDNRFTFMSDNAFALLGLPRSAPMGRSRIEIAERDNLNPPAVMAAHKAQLAARMPFRNFEYCIVDSSGKVAWISASGVPFFDEQGKFAGYRGIGQLVTARHQIEDELAQYRQRLEALVQERTAELEEARHKAEAATQAKSAFLANMSHEIRTPMNAIVGLTHMLRRDNVTPGQAERLGRIAGAADHLLAVINDILDISKIEAGKVALEQIDFELDGMLRRVSSIIALRTQAKGLELIVDVEGLPSHLRGDPTRLSQALINYLGNAVKFTERGIIVLRGRVIDETAAEVMIRFEVEDSGIGLDAAQLERVFAAFEQADSSTTRRYGGTGLGLAITKRLAEMMHGEVGARSLPGVGSTFWLSARFAKAARPHPPPAPAALRDGRVLVADDVAITQVVHSQLLRQLGMRPVAVVSGDQALAALSEADAQGDPFVVALIDLMMPDMDGIATLAQIADLALKKCPVCILVTASGDAEVANSARAAGFVDVLVKPVSAALLQACLLAHLAGRREPLAAPRETPEAALRRLHAGARVLLVEDEPINQLIAREMLEDLGLQVTIAGNGQEALDLAAQNTYDLILTDMQMPVMDGLEATRRMRALSRLQSVPIVAMTANAFAEDRANCLAAGMSDFIAKPIDPENLFATLLYWLTAARP